MCMGSGCGADEPMHVYASEYETGEVMVRLDGTLCAAHLDFLDEHVRRLESVLVAESDDLVDITIHGVVPISECGQGFFGCFKRGEIHTYWWSVDHEVVHAVHARAGTTSAFWREGLAEALRGKRTERGDASVLDSIGKPGDELDYATAGHFSRWLIEDYGIDHVPALARGEPFDSIFGVSLEDAAAAYEGSAPWSYPGDPSRCDFAPLGVDGTEMTTTRIVVGCDEETASQYIWPPSANRTLTIDTAGTFELSISPGFGVFVMPCQLDVVEDEPENEYLGDVLIEGVEDGFPSYFGSDVPSHSVQLEPAKYLVTLIPDEGIEGPQTVTVGFQREMP